MNSQPFSAMDFIDPGQYVSRSERRLAMVAAFVPWLGTAWLCWCAIRGDDKPKRRAYGRLACLSIWVTLVATVVLH
jgi:hypothetical protein